MSDRDNLIAELRRASANWRSTEQRAIALATADMIEDAYRRIAELEAEAADARDSCRIASIERDALRAENEALRKDAERYRYARREDLIGRLGQDPFGDCHCDFDSIDDAAIDAAMAKEKQP